VINNSGEEASNKEIITVKQPLVVRFHLNLSIEESARLASLSLLKKAQKTGAQTKLSDACSRKFATEAFLFIPRP